MLWRVVAPHFHDFFVFLLSTIAANVFGFSIRFGHIYFYFLLFLSFFFQWTKHASRRISFLLPLFLCSSFPPLSLLLLFMLCPAARRAVFSAPQCSFSPTHSQRKKTLKRERCTSLFLFVCVFNGARVVGLASFSPSRSFISSLIWFSALVIDYWSSQRWREREKEPMCSLFVSHSILLCVLASVVLCHLGWYVALC